MHMQRMCCSWLAERGPAPHAEARMEVAMRTKLGLVGLLLVLALGSASACSNSAQPEPQAGDGDPPASGEGKGDVSMPARPSAGGATGDFSGDCDCSDVMERELALD